MSAPRKARPGPTLLRYLLGVFALGVAGGCAYVTLWILFARVFYSLDWFAGGMVWGMTVGAIYFSAFRSHREASRCLWTLNGDGAWIPACDPSEGHFVEVGPLAFGFVHCCLCGDRIEERRADS